MELETINKLYLELSQVATAKTKKELELEARISKAIEDLDWYGNHTMTCTYDKNNICNCGFKEARER